MSASPTDFDHELARTIVARAQAHVETLPDGVRESASRFVLVCKEVLTSETSGEGRGDEGATLPTTTSPGAPGLLPASPPSGGAERRAALKKEVRMGTELLARGGARVMPLGALGRAASALLSGAPRDATKLLAECGEKLALFGA